MTTVGKTMFPLSNGIRNITDMKARYDKLQTQLATGEKATTLAEMGSDRYFDLALRQRMARIEGYRQSISTVNLRLEVLDSVMRRVDTIESDARAAALSGGGGTSGINFQSTPTLAMSRFDELLTLLNTDIAGRYMFGGNKTEDKPVALPMDLMNGVGARAGFKQVASERKLADLGADHSGRLDISTTTDTVTLAEENTVFGMKLSGINTTSANITVTTPSGSPQQLTVQFGATLPTAGDKVQISFTMPDGTEEQITLVATNGTPTAGEFQIGADADATAASFQAALTASITDLADTNLVSASAYAAAENFFNGQGQQVMRVDGPPFDTATGLIAGTNANTMFWYSGEDSADPRNTVTARVGEGTTVGYGVQANEMGFVNLIQTLAAVAVQDFPDSDPTSEQRYTSMMSRNANRLADTKDNNPGSLAAITVELGLAQSTTGSIGERHTAHAAQLGNMLEAIEEAPTETIAMEILALKTRLEASYQTTSLLSQLSLVNYLR
jgi:flagellin-like hook-associated protein FlgL